MRVLFITRTHPHRPLGSLESRLHDRLTELSELGHEVLILTRWSGESVDFELPKRIEVRYPFKTFRPWEWTQALPMVFAWRPDLLHIFDPGLSSVERVLSVEMMAMTMMDTLRRASRGRSSYQGGLVSVSNDGATDPALFEALEGSWKRAGAGMVEDGWLRSGLGSRFGEGPLSSRDQAWDRAPDRRLRLALAGNVGTELAFTTALDAVHALKQIEDVELTLFLDRARLKNADRRELARAERIEAFGSAIGSRVHIANPEATTTTAGFAEFDAGILVTLSSAAAHKWLERLPIPLVISEGLKNLPNAMSDNKPHSRILGQPVTEVAPFPSALRQAADRQALESAWSQIEQGTLAIGRDIAANHVSRIYSQIARLNSPS